MASFKPGLAARKTLRADRASGLDSIVRNSAATQEPASERARVAVEQAGERYGKPILIQPRLGQGTFRVLVTDVYHRQCATTGEKVLPVLEAAQIRPYGEGGEHRIDNGLLLRSDAHTLFDRGYITVTHEYRVEVSGRLKTDFENGREYYALRGLEIMLPERVGNRPANDFLAWHNEICFVELSS